MKLVGVLPAAGRAERLQPLPSSKEVLRLGGRPVLEYAVERLRAAAVDEIRIVTRPDKKDVIAAAERLGLVVVEAEPLTVAESVLAGAQGLGEPDIVLLDLPDSLWEPRDGFVSLVAALEEDDDAAVALGLFSSTEPERGDVVETGDDGRVLRVEVKPARPRGNLVWGCVAARAPALSELRRHGQPGELFDALAERGRVRAVRFPGEFVDIGTREALAHAREALG